MTLKQDLLIAASGVGLGVFIGLGIGAYQNTKMILPPWTYLGSHSVTLSSDYQWSTTGTFTGYPPVMGFYTGAYVPTPVIESLLKTRHRRKHHKPVEGISILSDETRKPCYAALCIGAPERSIAVTGISFTDDGKTITMEPNPEYYQQLPTPELGLHNLVIDEEPGQHIELPMPLDITGTGMTESEHGNGIITK